MSDCEASHAEMRFTKESSFISPIIHLEFDDYVVGMQRDIVLRPFYESQKEERNDFCVESLLPNHHQSIQ
jgi:hypothetical protein